jgi:hypothetical protein
MNNKTSRAAPDAERELAELVREESVTERGQAEEAAQPTQDRLRDLIAPGLDV